VSAEASPAFLVRLTGLLLIVMAAAAGFAALGAHGAPGLVGYLVAFLCDVPVAIFFYVLLEPVGRTLSLTAAAFRLVYAAVAGAALLTYLGDLTRFSDGFSLALVFFGVHLLLLGWLLWRSPIFPRIFGPLIVLAGASYLVNSLSHLLAPALNAGIARFLTIPAMAELALALWMVLFSRRPSAARRLAAG
jgi:hypothetical protein